MKTIHEHMTSLTTVKDAHAQMYLAAERMAAVEPSAIQHRLTADESRRKYDAIGKALDALQGAL